MGDGFIRVSKEGKKYTRSLVTISYHLSYDLFIRSKSRDPVYTALRERIHLRAQIRGSITQGPGNLRSCNILTEEGLDQSLLGQAGEGEAKTSGERFDEQLRLCPPSNRLLSTCNADLQIF